MNEGQKMTTTPTQQPEALKLADALHEVASLFGFPSALLQSAAELRYQHAEIARLHAENEALRSAVADAVAAERMACMVVCDQLQAPKSYTTDEQSLWDVATMACTDAIRALGTP